MSSTDAWHIALAIFLVLTGVTLAYVLFRASKLLGDVEKHLDETMVEVVPMLGKASVTLDHVNDELEKVGKITDSAVGAVGTVDHAARAASSAAALPALALERLECVLDALAQAGHDLGGLRGGVV